MNQAMTLWRRLSEEILTRERGQGLYEYALIISLVAIVLVGSVTLFGTDLVATFNRIDILPIWGN